MENLKNRDDNQETATENSSHITKSKNKFAKNIAKGAFFFASLTAKTIRFAQIVMILGIVTGVMVVIFYSDRIHGWMLSFSQPTHIESTPLVIEELKAVKQFNFITYQQQFPMTLHKESNTFGFLGKTTEKGRLVVLLDGKANIGIDMSEAKENWITTVGKAVKIELPSIQIINRERQMINELTIKPFIEEGKWDYRTDVKKLAKLANTTFEHSLYLNNLTEQAAENGKRYFQYLFKSLGYDSITVVFDEREESLLATSKQKANWNYGTDNKFDYITYNNGKVLRYNLLEGKSAYLLFLFVRDYLTMGDEYYFRVNERSEASLYIQFKALTQGMYRTITESEQLEMEKNVAYLASQLFDHKAILNIYYTDRNWNIWHAFRYAP